MHRGYIYYSSVTVVTMSHLCAGGIFITVLGGSLVGTMSYLCTGGIYYSIVMGLAIVTTSHSCTGGIFTTGM